MFNNFNLFTDEGWFDYQALIENTKDYPIVIVNGGRGTGKTFGALKYYRERPELGQFIYLRRTQTQLDTINKQEFSPFTDVDNFLGTLTVAVPLSKYNAGYYNAKINEDGKLVKADNNLLGFSCALSTISNLRSFRSTGINTIIYDEYIPEVKDRPIKGEADALFNAYETVNRNRELKGEPAVKMVLMANTNKIDNPIIVRLGLANILTLMQMTNKDRFYMPERGIAIFNLKNSPISEKKEKTALYRALGVEDDMAKMALSNQFNDINCSDVKSIDSKQLKPIVAFGGIYVYGTRFDDELIYISDRDFGCANYYPNNDDDTKRALRKYGNKLLFKFYKGNVLFADFGVKLIFKSLLKV